ncbi:hypothetical protein ANCCEY_00267 [Ancylostoma ceylanicum]|uniref:DUF7774 domain-containing protein n=1 Tax=Ancylostoma ceylanicum TaxID=53326 RepID=A0A0D6M957_9BILA|nr:hypothetical protein ANCCEY_00267 [Ancylostoma ceylanicum]
MNAARGRSNAAGGGTAYEKKETTRKGGSEEAQCVTVFEKCDAPSRPAIAKETEYKLRWKTPQPEKKAEDVEKFSHVDVEELQQSREFQLARKIMIQLRRNNILESAVNDNDLPVLKRFFKEELNYPTKRIVDIIDRAMNYCYEEIVYHQDFYSFHVDTEMRQFLMDKEKSKQFMLDVLLTCPEFVPLMWGGEAVGLPSEVWASIILFFNGQFQKENVSPWNRLVEKPVVPEKKDMNSPWNRLVEKAEKPQHKFKEHKMEDARKASSDTKSDEATRRRDQKAQPSDKSDDDRVAQKSDEDLKKKSAESSQDKSDDSKEDKMKRGSKIEAKKKDASREDEKGRKRSEVRRVLTDIVDKRKSSIRQRSRSEKKKAVDSRTVNSLERASLGQGRKSGSDERTSSGEKSRSSEATKRSGSMTPVIRRNHINIIISQATFSNKAINCSFRAVFRIGSLTFQFSASNSFEESTEDILDGAPVRTSVAAIISACS